MPARRPQTRRRAEPTIALINIVFLLLVFFLVASRIAPPLPEGLDLVAAEGLEPTAPPGMLVALVDGSLWQAGRPTDIATAVAAAGDGPLRLMPDRHLPASALLAIGRGLREAGAEDIYIVGTRTAPEAAQ